MADYEIPVHVQGCDPTLGKNTYRTISGALLYDHPDTGRTYHIVIQRAVEIPDLKHHMLCPMQVRTNSVTLNYYSIFLTEYSTEKPMMSSMMMNGAKICFTFMFIWGYFLFTCLFVDLE